MASTHPTFHKGSRNGSYYMDCDDVRIYVTDTGQSGRKKWLAKCASLPVDAKYFSRMNDAKEWAHDVLCEYT